MNDAYAVLLLCVFIGLFCLYLMVIPRKASVAKYSVAEIDEMRDLLLKINELRNITIFDDGSYYNPPGNLDMTHLESRLRTYMENGNTVKELKAQVNKELERFHKANIHDYDFFREDE